MTRTPTAGAAGGVVPADKDTSDAPQPVPAATAAADLMTRHAQVVMSECRRVTTDQYPFDPKAASDVPLGDFGKLFGYDGVFDRFFDQSLEPLVNAAWPRWTWRAGTAPPPEWMLQQFEAARQIRDSFFRPGSHVAEVQFRLTSVALSSEVTRLRIRIDGQSFEDAHGPPYTKRVTWPGNTGEAVVTFQRRNFDASAQIVHRGNWALLRLLDHDAVSVQMESPARHMVTIRQGDDTARVLIEADSGQNPFVAWNLVRGFRCGAS